MLSLQGFVVSGVLGQEKPVKGRVSNAAGQPVADVTVYGSRDRTKTDVDGQFRLQEPGLVIHLQKEGLQPLSLVIQREEPELEVTMEPANGSMTLPACGKLKPGEKWIPRGKYGLRFSAPMHDIQILGGKPDVDYVRYELKTKSGKAYLELWFGIYALGADPDDDLIVNSVKYRERNVVDSSGQLLGRDSRGELKDGTIWRQTIDGAEGSRYENASPSEAELFDHIVDSVCIAVQPKP